MPGEAARDLGRDPAPARVREQPVPDLDDQPLAVEMVEHGPAEEPPGAGVDGDEREQPAAVGERRQVREGVAQILCAEPREVARLDDLGIREGGRERVDIVGDGEAQ